MDTTKFLSKIFLFESLTEEQINLFRKFTSVKEIGKGDFLFSEGQPATAFFIVVSGSIKVYKLSAEGNEQILHIQKPNDLLAEAVIFEFETYPAYAQALEETTLVRISKNEIRDLLRHFPEISFQIMRAYSRRIRQLVNKIEEISLFDVKSRLANYLIKNSSFKNNQYTCHLTLSKKDLAAVLGTIPETLSRAFNFFKKEKILTEETNKLIILDLKKMETYC
jgi:CRP/FNR family transcriptional regulator, dissimilatory nitrate respiration regulator